jgi:hypothetical protein
LSDGVHEPASDKHEAARAGHVLEELATIAHGILVHMNVA